MKELFFQWNTAIFPQDQISNQLEITNHQPLKLQGGPFKKDPFAEMNETD